ncbi:RICIN domain-containing protein [Kitasatospora sp. NPDC093550]|uniref:RICIN domain-containing protein n=1 Tax=Kitasatospora sp. NPDC093550 TaxID=3364089 RepID=UPI00382BA76D
MPATVLTAPGNPGRTAPWLRVLAALLAACCAALGLAAGPAHAAPAPGPAPAPATAAGCGGAPLNCLTLTSLGNGRRLDVQNGNTGDGVYVVTNSAPGYHQSWRLNVDPSDYTFTIVNNDTGKCVDLAAWFVPALRQQTCAGQAGQRWFLQPAPGGGDAFAIRHAGDNTCLDLLAGAQYDDAWTDQYACNGTVNQQWATGAPQAARTLAVDHAAKQCQKDASTCSWAVRGEAPAAPLPRVCSSAVWFNNTAGTVQQTFAVTDMSGWSTSLGSEIGSEIGGGMEGTPLKAAVKVGLSFTNVWNGSRSVNNAVTVTVPPQQYGWVTLAEVARQVTGTWTFDAHGIPWTADDTITVPVTSDPVAGPTLYVANTSPTFTSCS